jgi:hypothetical protein
MSTTKSPKELDAIVDVVLAYRPKPKSKPGKKRRKMQRIVAAQTDIYSKKNNLRKTD